MGRSAAEDSRRIDSAVERHVGACADDATAETHHGAGPTCDRRARFHELIVNGDAEVRAGQSDYRCRFDTQRRATQRDLDGRRVGLVSDHCVGNPV
jgi:hypothetical protein